MTKIAKRIIVITLSVILLVAIIISLYVFIPAFPLTSKWLSPEEVSSENFKNLNLLNTNPPTEFGTAILKDNEYLNTSTITQINVFKDITKNSRKITIKSISFSIELENALKNIKFKKFYKTLNEKSAYKGYKPTIEVVVFDNATNDLYSIYLNNNFNYGGYHYKCNNSNFKFLLDELYKSAYDFESLPMDGDTNGLMELADGRYVERPAKVGYSLENAKLNILSDKLKSKANVKVTNTNENYYLNGTSTYITKEVNGKSVPIMVLQAFKKSEVLDDNSLFFVSINGVVDERYFCGHIGEYMVGEKDGYIIYDFLPLIADTSGYDAYINGYSQGENQLTDTEVNSLKETRVACVKLIK